MDIVLDMDMDKDADVDINVDIDTVMDMGVSRNQEPQYRPQNSRPLCIGTLTNRTGLQASVTKAQIALLSLE